MNYDLPLETLILTIRNKKVLIDADLATIYGVPTKALNQAVKRNADRFPEDFRFQLTREEAEEVLLSRSQIVTTSAQSPTDHSDPSLRSQSVTSKPEIGFHVREEPSAYPARKKASRSKSS